jgi:glyoxylase-like metal-dependent hydrolase (beta-lactamase superfamily II)
MKLAPSVHRLGGGLVNSYLIDEAGEVTIIDAGVPGYWGDLPGELAAMGRTIEDVRALVLTHGHSDHIGFAERLRRERHVPVKVHELDAALARGEVKNSAKSLGATRLRPILRFLLWSAWRGGLRIPRIAEVATFGDGATLDVPGAPRVILVPGHTPGSAALHVPSLSAVFVGDALATESVTTGDLGPRIAPFTADAAEALASLDRLAGLDAALVLPGHGQAWTGGVDEAIRAVRTAAAAGPKTAASAA